VTGFQPHVSSKHRDIGYLGQLVCKLLSWTSFIHGQRSISLVAHVFGHDHQPRGGNRFCVAHPCPTPLRMIHPPTAIVWEPSQVASYNAKGRLARPQGRIDIGTYPSRHRLPVLRYVVLYSSFPTRDRTLRATDREHRNVSVHVSGSTGIELPPDVFGQARDTVRVLPWTRKAQAKL